MTEPRWAQVKALFQAAVERPASERAAFLAAAAGADEALRQEVESLLRSDNADASLTGLLQRQDAAASGAPIQPLYRSADDTRTQARPTVRGSIGPYRVIGFLGVGGMGEVFRARDSKLNRDVALKLLPSAVEFDPDRLARFRREARVLAALNHAHIAAIYGLEESDGRHALVLELVEGVTLAERIANGPLTVTDTLQIAHQIAGALEAAHEKGIVHRDLKPANIKVTPTGAVKVLDFGLAKTAGAERPIVAEAVLSSTGDGRTHVGAVLGTAAYMSPEQARGMEVDARTDVWAFGCVLFEMLTRRKAFGADADSDSTEKVLARDPDWAALPTLTPSKIRGLLRRCLEKDPTKRLQTIAEARQAIGRLLAGHVFGSSTRLAAASLATVLVVAGVAVYLSSSPGQKAGASDWVQLTNLDAVTQPALSPDGRMLAFLRGPSTFVSPGQLYVKLLPDGDPVPLTQDGFPKMGPVFSPDGSRIAYSINDGNSWDTWEVAALQGTPRHWLKNASGLAWIDSENLVFSEIKTGLHMAVVRSTAAGDRQDLYVPAHQNAMAHRSYPSPDRQWVLVVEMDEKSLWIPCRLVGMAGGPSRQVGPGGRCTGAAWSPDGRWMYFTADAGDGFHVWRQRFPSGQPEQITFGPTEEEGLAIAPDGRSLITSVGLSQRSVWVRDSSGERQISLEGYAYWPLLSADGQKVCFRVTRGVGTGQSPSELWVADLRSGTTQRLFPGQLVTGYDVSRDDRVVAAVQDPSGRLRLWLAPLDGRQAPQPIPGADGDNPRFGTAGEIIFRVSDGNSATLYRLSEDGRRRAPMAEASASVIGTTSPDGAWLSNVSTGAGSMSLYSTRGAPPIPVLPYGQSTRLRWSHDGKHAYISVQYGQASAFAVGRTYVLPLPDGSVLPRLPQGGFQTEAELASVAGATVIPYGDVSLGASPSVYAYSHVTTTRNLYRIPLP